MKMVIPKSWVFNVSALICTLCPIVVLSQDASRSYSPDVTYPRDGFLKKLQIARGTDVQLYILADKARYCDRITGIVIEVPKGFVTDFASIPWWATVFQKRDVLVGDAAVIHDWLYAVGISEVNIDNKKIPGRDFADLIFRNYLLELGVKEWKANAMYKAVRKGGIDAYSKCETRRECKDWLFADSRSRTIVSAPITIEEARSKIGNEVSKGCLGEEWIKPTRAILEKISNRNSQ